MASTNFTDYLGPPVDAAWLNDVNNAIYNVLPNKANLAGSATQVFAVAAAASGTNNALSRLQADSLYGVLGQANTWQGYNVFSASASVSGHLIINAASDFADTYGPHNLYIEGPDQKNVLAIGNAARNTQFAFYINQYAGNPIQLGTITNSAFGFFTYNGTPQLSLNPNGGISMGSYGSNTVAPPANGLTVSGVVLVGTTTNNFSDQLQVSGSVSATNFKGLVNGNTITTGTGTLTLGAGSTLATSGAFSTTFVASAATTQTLPGVSSTLAGLGNANTWSAVQTFTTASAGIKGIFTNSGTSPLPCNIYSGNGLSGIIDDSTFSAEAFYFTPGAAYIQVNNAVVAHFTSTGHLLLNTTTTDNLVDTLQVNGSILCAQLKTTQTPTASSTASDHSVPIVLNGVTYYMRLSSTA